MENDDHKIWHESDPDWDIRMDDIYNKGTVYGLVCPLTNRVRNIGSTRQGLSTRLSLHFYANVSLTGKWMRKLKRLGKRDEVEIIALEENLPHSKLHDAEIAMIEFYYLMGYDLTNVKHN